MKMEIIATFPIQLYISIYSTIRLNFSMFCADCSSIVFEVIDTHSLISCTMLDSRSWCVSVRLLFSLFSLFSWWNNHWCATVDKRDKSGELLLPPLWIFGWTASRVQPVSTHLLSDGQQKIASACDQGEDAAPVKSLRIVSTRILWQWLYVYCDMQRMTQ